MNKKPLSETHPELAKEAYGWDPKKVNAGTHKKLKWKCNKGHIWEAIVVNRSRKKVGCSICDNKKLLVGFNDLATSHPELAKEAYGWDPKTVIAGAGKKYEWKCSKGHTWIISISNRKNGSKCPICLNQELLIGFNDLATTHPELAKEACGWDPKKVIAGGQKRWKCNKGHIWSTTIKNRKKGRNCPSCTKFGFNPNEGAYLYFLIQPDLELYQIGITNNPKIRLSVHRANGFELLEIRGPMDGHTAQELETGLLRYLKSQNAYLSPESAKGKFDGYSESWTIDSHTVNNLKELIDKASVAGF